MKSIFLLRCASWTVIRYQNKVSHPFKQKRANPWLKINQGFALRKPEFNQIRLTARFNALPLERSRPPTASLSGRRQFPDLFDRPFDRFCYFFYAESSREQFDRNLPFPDIDPLLKALFVPPTLPSGHQFHHLGTFPGMFLSKVRCGLLSAAAGGTVRPNPINTLFEIERIETDSCSSSRSRRFRRRPAPASPRES